MTFRLIKWTAVIALALGLSGWVDPWYTVVNYIVFISGLYGSWITRQQGMHGWVIVLALTGIVFNPFASPAFFSLYQNFIELSALVIFLLSPPELNEEVNIEIEE